MVSSNPNQRNWRGILIAMLVIASVLALIVTSVVLLTPPDQGPKIKPGRLKLSHILSHQLAPYTFNGSWISGEEIMYRDEFNNIAVMSAVNLSTKIVMNNQTYRRFNAVRFSMSPDHQYILLVHNTQKLFRHSFLAQYTVFDVQAGQTFSVTVTDRDNDKPFLVHAEWSKRGHSLIIILDYDIYYRPHPRTGPVYRVTNTAVPGLIHNGVPDWLYEEEILNDNKAIWMSRDGHMLLYASFNDTLVQEFQFPWYGVSQDTQQLYPQIRSLRYPKPGTTNPHVTLYVADLADPKNIRTRDLKPPIAFQQSQTTDYYFNGVSWVSATEVAVIWMNRAQNISMVTLCKSPMWYCQETQRVTGEGSGWVEAPPPPIFSEDGNTYLTLAPVRDGAAGYFRHVVSVNIPKKRFIPITHGTFEVMKIAAWDTSNNVVYYLAVSLSQLHLYSIKTVSGSSPVCITCPKANPDKEEDTVHRTAHAHEGFSVDEEEPEPPPTTQEPPAPPKRKKPEPHFFDEPLYKECLYHNVYFSPDATHYVLECLGPGIPTVSLYQAPSLYLANLQNNTHLYVR
ncbi:hypothetical protein GE061_008625 [Apolygus lucorum]|uniref:Dipeptidylpeptidase IV N-terminal domain-containing protein n=2 Tax=Mirini TaxID=236659 RepID=A0A6A4J1J2_APOLU|nr:hypothetical protein GE061_008625 [Apolygus lucorum]